MTESNPDTRRLLGTTDWSGTPVGAMTGWSRVLIAYVDMIMAMPSPAIIFWGPEQTQIYNDGYAVIMGPRHPRYFGAPYKECWPDTYPLIYPHMQRVLKGETWTVERTHIPVTRHGFDEEAYFTFTFSPLKDDEGTVAGILQPVFDVSESVIGERRAETLRLLAMARTSVKTPIEEAMDALAQNPGDVPFCRIWRRDEDDPSLRLAGHVGLDLDAEEGARIEARAAALGVREKAEIAAQPGARWRTVQLFSLADGTGERELGVIALGVSARLMLNDRYREFFELVARHIAAVLDRERTQQAEARHRQYLNELFLEAPAGVAVTHGPEHVFELVNPAYSAIVGHRKLVGLKLLDAFPELRGHALSHILDEVFRRGEPYVGTEVKVALYRGSSEATEDAYFNFVYQPLHDARGTTNGILVFAYEVTVQVQARQRAERLSEELILEQRQKDDFLAMLAHELRNPLAPISAAAELLRRGTRDPEHLRRTADIVARQVSHMAALIDDLLDASRVTRGLVQIARLPENLYDVVITAIEQARPLIERHQHRLSLHFADRTLMVSGDRKRLVQVVANLLDNAAKYSPESSNISLTVAAEPDSAVIRVQDEGAGISAALLPRVFDLFVQGDRGVDRREGGLGIGLALVRSLTELHGGTVSVHSIGEGRGTEFVVRLPLIRGSGQTSMAAREAAPGASSSAETSTVLIVDDNVDAAQSLAMLLEMDGHLTWVEHHPLDALKRAAQVSPQICVVDIGLPEMDGYALARQLRALPEAANARLIALTGYGQPADQARAKEAGFDEFIVKPIDPQRLQQLLKRS